MVLTQRQSELLELLSKKKRMSVKAIAKHFYVSEMTVRRDLAEMEKCGYLQRYNGGAVYVDDDITPISERKLLHSKEKSRLTKHAKKYLANAMSVFIDSSSTCLYIIPLLADYKQIQLITNSVQGLLLASKYHIPCIFAGGEYFERDMCSVGSLTEEFLRSINVDIAFFSSSALSDDGIISDIDLRQTSVRKIVMQNAQKSIFLFTEEKLHRKEVYTLCRSEDADDIIII